MTRNSMRGALAALAPLAAGLLAAAAPSAAGAQVTSSYTCVGGICDIIDLTFSFAGGSRSLTSLALNTGGFAGFVFQDGAFGGQLNEVSPPLVGGTPGRFWTGVIGGGGSTLTSSSCASTAPSYPLCGASDLAGSATIRVYFQYTGTLGSPADFGANAGFTITTVDAGGMTLTDTGRFAGSADGGPGTTVPEPASVALVAVGLAGLAAGVVRRRAGGAAA